MQVHQRTTTMTISVIANDLIVWYGEFRDCHF